MSKYEHGDWLVYINGLEIPTISVVVSQSSAGLPVCNINLVPDAGIQDIGRGDKLRVVIWYLDVHYTKLQKIQPDYRLLGEFEITGRSVSSTPSGKQLTLTCGDIGATLLSIYPNMITDLNQFAQDETGVGATTSFFGVPFAQNVAILTTGVDQGGTPSTEQKLIRRPYDIVKNILSAMGNVEAPPKNKSTLMRIFYNDWNTRTQFDRRFLPSFGLEYINDKQDPIPFPIMRAATSDQILQVLKGMTEQLGDQANMWQYMQSILQSFFYNVTPILAPSMMYTDANQQVVAPAENVNTAPGDTSIGSRGAAADTARLTMGAYITHPDMSFAVPPACNVIWPPMIIDHSFQEDYMSPPTRTYLGDSHLLNMLNQQNDALRQVAQLALTVGFPARAQQLLEAGKDGTPVNFQDYMIDPEEYYRGPHIQQVGIPSVFMFLGRAGTDDNITKGIMPLYAEMAHYRSVYSSRTGQVTMLFNPYVVLNMPILVIDPNEGNNHVYAKVTGITHNLVQKQRTTTVTYTMGRFASEMIVDYIKRSIAGEEDLVPSIPKEPVKEISSQLQDATNAADYYSAMLYGGQPAGDVTSKVFDFREAFGFSVDPNFQVTSPLDQRAFEVINNAPDTVYFSPQPKYVAQMTDHNAAMSYVCRPVCKLTDYVKFMGDLGVMEGEEVPTSSSTVRHGGVFWRRILRSTLRSSSATPTNASGDPCGPPANKTAKDWDSKLLAYRNKMYGLLYYRR